MTNREGLDALEGTSLADPRECQDMLGGVVSTYPSKPIQPDGLRLDSVKLIDRWNSLSPGRFPIVSEGRYTPNPLAGWR